LSGVVVDANVACEFLRFLLTEEENQVSLLFECLESSMGFAIDEGGALQHQWFESCNNIAFHGWFLERVKNGVIRVVKEGIPNQHRKHLRNNCGFPYSSRHEGKYVEVAYCASPHVLVTNDIDFWEPTAKKDDSARKEYLKKKGKGSVATYLYAELGIRVLTPTQAFSHLGC